MSQGDTVSVPFAFGEIVKAKDGFSKVWLEESLPLVAERSSRIVHDGLQSVETLGEYARFNVHAVGVGRLPASRGAPGELCIQAFVFKKVPSLRLPSDALIPEEFDGIPVDVIECAPFVAMQDCSQNRKKRLAEVPGGVSIGNLRLGTCGTAGGVVASRKQPNKLLLLSANHVLARWDEGVAGDVIVQPSRPNGGMPVDAVAELQSYTPVWTLGPSRKSPRNRFDAAVVPLIGSRTVKREVCTIGVVDRSAKAVLGAQVTMHGGMSARKSGTVYTIATDVVVDLNRRSAFFESQVMVQGTGGSFAVGGDSGSLVVTDDGGVPAAVGLVIAGTSSLAVLSPIDEILSGLDVKL